MTYNIPKHKNFISFLFKTNGLLQILILTWLFVAVMLFGGHASKGIINHTVYLVWMYFFSCIAVLAVYRPYLIYKRTRQ